MVQRIDDHSFWAGKAQKGCVFPEGAKRKEYSSAEGAGELRNYEQSSEQIQKMQEMGEKQVDKHGRKDYHRN